MYHVLQASPAGVKHVPKGRYASMDGWMAFQHSSQAVLTLNTTTLLVHSLRKPKLYIHHYFINHALNEDPTCTLLMYACISTTCLNSHKDSEAQTLTINNSTCTSYSAIREYGSTPHVGMIRGGKWRPNQQLYAKTLSKSLVYILHNNSYLYDGFIHTLYAPVYI